MAQNYEIKKPEPDSVKKKEIIYKVLTKSNTGKK